MLLKTVLLPVIHLAISAANSDMLCIAHESCYSHTVSSKQLIACNGWLVVWLQHTRTMMGPYIDIPGPEISAGSRMMSWLFDEYSKYKRFSPACVTGKVRPSRQTTTCVLMLVEG